MLTREQVFSQAGGVEAFQKSMGLVVDGDAGPKTNNAALRVMLGLAKLAIPSASPGKDGKLRPGLDSAYGQLVYVDYPKEKIKVKRDAGRILVDSAWEKANLVQKTLWDGQKIRIHKDASEEFDFIFKAAVEASGYHPTYTVGYSPRHTLWNPGRSLSTHSWGCAADFNPDDNDLGGVDARGQPSKMRKNPEFAKTFKFWGWTWGGDWSMRDDMHFQRAFV